MSVEYTELKTLTLKNHPEINESWVQNIIAENPKVLGLGELYLKDKERMQPNAGRLDLLLQDMNTDRRYEVEIQLGATDPSHIIRTIEYWDIERKRYPQYDHCAVIVAEEITSRFLNVISLFNGNIPLIALKMSAVELGGKTSIMFTKVLDEMVLGVDDEDVAPLLQTDRAYWNDKAATQTVKLADRLLQMLKDLDPELELNFNKNYIGLSRNHQAFNFVEFRPKKKRVNLAIKLPKSEELDQMIDESEIDQLEYRSRWQQYQLSLSEDDIDRCPDILMKLFKFAYERRVA